MSASGEIQSLVRVGLDGATWPIADLQSMCMLLSMRYRATWIDAGHVFFHHEADTADAIIEWGERMLSGQIGVVWVTVFSDASERIPLAEFKRRFSVSQKE